MPPTPEPLSSIPEVPASSEQIPPLTQGQAVVDVVIVAVDVAVAVDVVIAVDLVATVDVVLSVDVDVVVVSSTSQRAPVN